MIFDPGQQAAILRIAMKGFGTDEKALVDTICSLTNLRLQQVRLAYKREPSIQRDLITDLQSETRGDAGEALIGLVYTPAEFDAVQLHKATKGCGTDEDALIQTLCHRTTDEIVATCEVYEKMFGQTLKNTIEGELHGHDRKVALGLINPNRETPKVIIPPEVDAWVDALYRAGEGKMGTDEDTFVEAMCSAKPDWLKAVNEAYGRKYGHTLDVAIEKEFSGFAAKALVTMLEDHDTYYAYLIKQSCQGPGTIEAQLTRVIVSQRDNLKQINERLQQMYGTTLKDMVHKELGNKSLYARIIHAVVEASSHAL